METFMKGYERFIALRRMLLNALDKVDMSDGCKSYEGIFELTFSYPDYFDSNSKKDDPDFCMITLHCYVLGPGRHYEWRGKTIEEAVKKCEHDIKQWIKDYDG